MKYFFSELKKLFLSNFFIVFVKLVLFELMLLYVTVFLPLLTLEISKI